MKSIPSIRERCLLTAGVLLAGVIPAFGAWQIGLGFNQGQAGIDDPAPDVHRTQDGEFTGDWAGDTFFGPGFSGRSGDFAIYGAAASPRVTLDLGATPLTAWDSFTIEMHVFVGADIGAFRRAMDLGGDSSVIWTGDRLRLRLAATGDIDSAPLALGDWYHVAMVYDAAEVSDNVSFYINGSLIGTGTGLRSGLPSAPGPVHILANENGGSRWDGGSAIDDFRFTSAALDPGDFLLDGFGSLLVHTRIGLSFNEGQAGEGNPATDFYGNQDGVYIGNWMGDATYFEQGKTCEDGDYGILSAGNRVRINLSNVFNSTWGSFTVEANVYLGEETGDWRRVIDVGDGNGIYRTDENRFRMSLAQSGHIETGLLDPNRWYHVAAVYDAAAETVRFYLDEMLVGAGGPIKSTLVEPGHLFVGASFIGGSPWDGGGIIDDFRFTSAALAPDELWRDGFGAQLLSPPAVPYGFVQIFQHRNLGTTVPNELIEYAHLIDMVSPMWFEFTDAGDTEPLPEAAGAGPRDAYREAVQALGIQLLPVIRHFNPTNFLADENAISHAATQSVNRALAEGYDGLIINIEKLTVNEREALVDLMSRLHPLMQAEGLLLGIAVGPHGNMWDYFGLCANSDFVQVMFYDYAGHWKSVPGPTAPLFWEENAHDIERNLMNILSTGVPPGKILMGIPFYGLDFVLNEQGGVVDATAKYLHTLRAQKYARQACRQWDEAKEVPLYQFIDDADAFREVWFDNERSFKRRIDFANEHGLAGFGIWALAFENATPGRDFWRALERQQRAYAFPEGVCENVASVSAINYTTSGGQGKHLQVHVSFVDGPGNPVSGASVTIELYRNTALYATTSGTTGGNGVVSYSYNNAPSGTYVTEVVSFNHSELEFDGVTPVNSFVK